MNNWRVDKKKKKRSKLFLASSRDDSIETHFLFILFFFSFTAVPYRLVIERVDNNATETGRRMRRRTAGAALVESLCSRQYKAYTDEQLRDAMAAVQNGQMRLAEACNHFGIPITTLGRKIRTSTTTTSMATTTNGDEGK